MFRFSVIGGALPILSSGCLPFFCTFRKLLWCLQIGAWGCERECLSCLLLGYGFLGPALLCASLIKPLSGEGEPSGLCKNKLFLFLQGRVRREGGEGGGGSERKKEKGRTKRAFLFLLLPLACAQQLPQGACLKGSWICAFSFWKSRLVLLVQDASFLSRILPTNVPLF